MRPNDAFAALLALASAGASGAASIPAEGETPFTMMDRLYSYFGVSSFALTSSAAHVHSGASMRLTINFAPSPFPQAGVAVGTLGVSTPSLAVATNADTFSVTVRGHESGTLRFYVLLREDDNNDGVINLALGDDEWQSPELTIPPGVTTTFNIPLTSFVVTDAGSGNEIQNFTTTPKLAMLLDIHTKASYPGGIITTQRTLGVGHAGLYAGPQTTPLPCVGDLNIDRVVNTSDLAVILGHFGETVLPGQWGDLDGSTLIDTNDLIAFLGGFGAACP